jgi:hypothetical protein
MNRRIVSWTIRSILNPKIKMDCICFLRLLSSGKQVNHQFNGNTGRSFVMRQNLVDSPENTTKAALNKLRRYSKDKEITSFVSEVYHFSQKIKKRKVFLSSEQCNEISSIIQSRLLMLSSQQVVSVLRSLGECGFSFQNRFQKDFLNNVKELFLKKEEEEQEQKKSVVEDILLYLASLQKLRYSWKEHGKGETEFPSSSSRAFSSPSSPSFLSSSPSLPLLQLIRSLSKFPLSGKQYVDLFSAIVGIGIPWKEIDEETQVELLSKISDLSVKRGFSSPSRRLLLIMLSKLDMKIATASESVQKAYLDLVIHNLRSEEVREWHFFFSSWFLLGSSLLLSCLLCLD